MRIKPLTGQVLVLLLPRDEKIGEIFIPETANDGKATHDDMYVKRLARKGIVQSIGPWKKTKDGKAILPDFRKGQTILLNDYVGQKLTHDVEDNLRLIKYDDVLGVLTADNVEVTV